MVVGDLQTGDQKVRFESPGTEFYFLLLISSSHFFLKDEKTTCSEGDVSGRPYTKGKQIFWINVKELNRNLP